jgi:hypothetical protein
MTLAEDDAESPAVAPPDTDASPQLVSDARAASGGTPPKEPGWYPVRTNPNEQTYWDGRDWTGRRRWSPGVGWTEVGDAAGAVGTVAANGPRLSANPYAPHPTTSVAAPAAAPGATVGLLLMLASGIALMLGSVATWISVTSGTSGLFSLGGFHVTASATTNGVDPSIAALIGINGYLTLTGGVVVLLFAGLMMATDEMSIRIVGCFFSVVTLGLAIYAVVRLVQKINAAHPLHGTTIGIGWGVILVLGAAVLATLVTIAELTRSR